MLLLISLDFEQPGSVCGLCAGAHRPRVVRSQVGLTVLFFPLQTKTKWPEVVPLSTDVDNGMHCCFFTVPQAPSRFRATNQVHEVMTTTVTFSWDPSQGNGSQAVVDSYQIILLPRSQSHAILVQSLSWSVTLQHNIEYTAGVLAINCVGNSTASIVTLTIGKCTQVPNATIDKRE